MSDTWRCRTDGHEEPSFHADSRRQAIAEAVRQLGPAGGKIIAHRDMPGEHTQDQSCWCMPEVLDVMGGN